MREIPEPPGGSHCKGDPELREHLRRVEGYMKGCGLLAFPGTETPLRTMLATFMEERLQETVRIWMDAVGPALNIAESGWDELIRDIRDAHARWIAHIRNPDDVDTYAYLRQHARGGFISHFAPSRFLASQLKIRQIVADLLRRDLRDHNALPELLGLLDQEFWERTLHITDFFVEARERDLQDQKDSYRRSLDAAPVPIFTLQVPAFTIVSCNRVAEREVGRDEAGIIGRSLWELHPASEQARVQALCEETLQAGTASRENLHLERRDREPLPVDVRAALVDYWNTRHVETIYVDLSERKRLEVQLIQSEKMAAIGQLAAGIAHEIRNPLGIIMNALYDLAELLPNPRPDVREDLQIAKMEMARVQEIINNLLEFSRQSKGERQPVDLNDLIGRTLKLMTKYLQNSGVRAFADLAPIPHCNLNENGIRQVLLNLITNAVQAMPQGGELRIATAFAGPERIAISIRDTGVGIPQDRLASIFNPFYTTKEPGEGTGLGLSVVHSVVKNEGGSIDVKSELGKGTTFVLELPIDHPHAEEEDVLHAARVAPSPESI